MGPLRLHCFDLVESTNDVALRMAREGAPNGTAVLARSQTSGRGRRGRTWFDEPDSSLLMSVVAGRGSPVNEMWRLTFIASLAVRDCLSEFCSVRDLSLKWPNDVLACGRKISGILTEITGSPVMEASQTAAVVGIGINVTQAKMPDELADQATSVFLEVGRSPSINSLAEQVGLRFLDLCDRMLVGDSESLVREWSSDMWGLGQEVEVLTGGLAIRGTVYGIDAEGSLLILKQNGVTEPIRAAEAIRHVK